MGIPSNQSNGPLNQSLYTQGSGTASSDPFITVFDIRDPTTNDIQYPIKKRWINTATITEWILENFVSISGITTAHWININSATPTLLTLTGNTGGPVPPSAGNINVVGDGTTITIAGNPGTNTLTASLIGGSMLLQTLTIDHADAPGVNPVTPTAGATITITGVAVAAQNIPVRTETNTLHQVRIENQLTSTTTSLGKSITNAGLASFDSSAFSVDAATGFVSLAGSGFVASLTGDDGVSVTPTGGTINVHGAVVANATNAKAVFVKANGLHEDDVQVQVSAAIAATDVTKVGLAAFNNTQFTVDANGFVTIIGGSGPIEKFAMQTGTTPVTADGSGTVTVNGATIAAGTNPVRSHGTGASTYQIEVQTSQALAASDATKIGLSNFNSAQFTVDVNGFVSSTGNSISPSVTNIGISQSAGTTFNVTAADGTALSSTNPAFVVLQSLANPGQLKKFTITANQSFTRAGLGNSLFGVTTGVAWAQDVPFYLYAVSNGNNGENTIAFMISRIPHRTIAPVAGKIGQSGNTLASTQGSFFSLATVTAADYASSPCLCLGSLRMQYSGALWTIQTLINSDGIGQYNESIVFNFPVSQNGNATGSYFAANGGTAPIWTTQNATYQINRFGNVNFIFDNALTTPTTNGVGAVTLLGNLPLTYMLNSYNSSNFVFNNPAGTVVSLGRLTNPTSASTTILAYLVWNTLTNAGTLQNQDCATNANFRALTFVYKADLG